MKQRNVAWVGIAMLLLGVACAATNGDLPPAKQAGQTRDPAMSDTTPPTNKARTLKIAGDSYAPFERHQIHTRKSYPPLFDVVLTRAMPTPGWQFVIDKVDIDEQAGTVRAHVTEIGPKGIVAQMIANTQCRIPLGSVEAGEYALEVWVRRGTDAEYRLAQAFTLEAR